METPIGKRSVVSLWRHKSLPWLFISDSKAARKSLDIQQKFAFVVIGGDADNTGE